MGMRRSVEDRFWAKVDKSGNCWLWTGCIAPNGYGRMWYITASEYVHRVSFELHGGVIPARKTIDHICEVRACVNPAHLRVLTRQENASRGRMGKHRGLCKRGHDMSDPENIAYTERKSGPRKGEVSRYCAECSRINGRK